MSEMKSLNSVISQAMKIPENTTSTPGQSMRFQARPISTDDPYAEESDQIPEDLPECPYCGQKMRRAGWLNENGSIFWYPTTPTCSCEGFKQHIEEVKAEEARKEEERRKKEEAEALKLRVQKIIGESGMNARFLRRTFQTFRINDDNRNARMACKDYADRFSEFLPSSDHDPGRNGLILFGPCGVGKTHLAAAIANEVMATGTGVICMTMIDMLAKIKETFNSQGSDEAAVLKVYKDIPLLIIDDMGKEQATEWASSTIFNIINARYESMMPIVITSNYTPDQLVSRLTPRSSRDTVTAKATIDRLRETCNLIAVKGKNWRC